MTAQQFEYKVQRRFAEMDLHHVRVEVEPEVCVFAVHVKIYVLCPCGTTEIISMICDARLSNVSGMIDELAQVFDAHIRKEVADGILPPAWIEVLDKGKGNATRTRQV